MVRNLADSALSIVKPLRKPFRVLLTARSGCGPQLLAYDLRSGDLAAAHRVLDGYRIHGINTFPGPPEPESPGEPACNSTWVVVYGDRWLHVLRLSRLRPRATESARANEFDSSSVSSVSVGLVEAVRLPVRPAWVSCAVEWAGSTERVRPNGRH